MKKRSSLLSILALLLCLVLLSFASCNDSPQSSTPSQDTDDSQQTGNDSTQEKHPILALNEAFGATDQYELTFRFSTDAYGDVIVTIKTDGQKTYTENSSTGIKQFTETVGDVMHVYTEGENGWETETVPAHSENDSTQADFDTLFGAEHYTLSAEDASLYVMKSGEEPEGMRDVSLRITETGCVITALTVQGANTMPTEITVSGIGTTTVTIPQS